LLTTKNKQRIFAPLLQWVWVRQNRISWVFKGSPGDGGVGTTLRGMQRSRPTSKYITSQSATGGAMPHRPSSGYGSVCLSRAFNDQPGL